MRLVNRVDKSDKSDSGKASEKRRGRGSESGLAGQQAHVRAYDSDLTDPFEDISKRYTMLKSDQNLQDPDGFLPPSCPFEPNGVYLAYD